MALQGRRARLLLEYEKLINLERRSDFIKIEPVEVLPGMPPEKYVITFTCGGIAELNEDQSPKFSEFHQVSMNLSRDFPNQEPYLKWLTPIWHPNIEHKEPHHVCTNNVQNWYPAKSLDDLVITLGEMVQYRRYHAAWIAPFPLDKEAADWVISYAEPRGWVSADKPIDSRQLLRPMKTRLKAGQNGFEAKQVPPPPPVPMPIPKPSVQAGGRLKLGVKKPAGYDYLNGNEVFSTERPFSQESYIPKPTTSEELRILDDPILHTGESVRRQGIKFGQRRSEQTGETINSKPAEKPARPETAEKVEIPEIPEKSETVETLKTLEVLDKAELEKVEALFKTDPVIQPEMMVQKTEKFCNDCGEKFIVNDPPTIIDGRYICDRCEIFYR